MTDSEINGAIEAYYRVKEKLRSEAIYDRAADRVRNIGVYQVCQDAGRTPQRPQICAATNGRWLNIKFPGSGPGGAPGRRKECRGFSASARRRMMDRLNQVSTAAALPYFVTLTLPDDVFTGNPTEFAESAKVYLANIQKRTGRICPGASAFWRIEWQPRKSGVYQGKLVPHFHLMVFGLPERTLAHDGARDGTITEAYVNTPGIQEEFVGLLRRVFKEHVFPSERSGEKFSNRYAVAALRAEVDDGDIRKPMAFFDWVAMAWYHVVGSGNVDHFLAGCRVERVKTWRGVMSYCAKYIGKADEENIANIPAGRQWGIYNRACIPWATMYTEELTPYVGIRLRRVMRRYLEHAVKRRVKRHKGMTLYCNPEPFLRFMRSVQEREPF